MKGRRRAEVNILLRQGLEVFTGAAGLLWSRFHGGTVGSAFRTVCMDRRFCFCDRRVRSCGRRLRSGKKSGKRKKEDARDVPYNNSDKDDERKKKQKQQLEWQIEHLRLEWKEKELRCQNVREQCGDVERKRRRKKAERAKRGACNGRRDSCADCKGNV